MWLANYVMTERAIMSEQSCDYNISFALTITASVHVRVYVVLFKSFFFSLELSNAVRSFLLWKNVRFVAYKCKSLSARHNDKMSAMRMRLPS